MDKYVGVYSITGAHVKMIITRKNATFYLQPGGDSATPLKAMEQDKFSIEGINGVLFKFDSEKNQLTIIRPDGERVFTRER